MPTKKGEAPMSSSEVTRRDFLKIAGAATTAVAAGIATADSTAPSVASPRVIGANDRIIMAVIGTGGRGTGHVNELVSRQDAENIRCIATSDLFEKRLNRS